MIRLLIWLNYITTLHFSLPGIASLKLNRVDNWSLIPENAGITSCRNGIFYAWHCKWKALRQHLIRQPVNQINVNLRLFYKITFYLILKSLIFFILFHNLHVNLCVRKYKLRICLIICIINNILSKLFNNILKLC